MWKTFSIFTNFEVPPSKHESRKLFHLFRLNMYAYTNLWHLLCFRIKIIRGVHDSLFSRLWFLECSQIFSTEKFFVFPDPGVGKFSAIMFWGGHFELREKRKFPQHILLNMFFVHIPANTRVPPPNRPASEPNHQAVLPSWSSQSMSVESITNRRLTWSSHIQVACCRPPFPAHGPACATARGIQPIRSVRRPLRPLSDLRRRDYMA